MNHIKILILGGLLFTFQSCEEILNEPARSQFSEESLIRTKSGIESVLADAYSTNNAANTTRLLIKRNEMTTDILWQTGGGENGRAVPLINFNWNSSDDLAAFDWLGHWQVIRNSNIVLDNIDEVTDFNSDTEKNAIIAEARTLRVWAYTQLWDQYGPLPVRYSLSDPLELARAGDSEFASFIETELTEAIPDLPLPGEEDAYGRIHSGGAQALLCKWYLNTNQWQKCADLGNQIISDGHFDLMNDYNALFALENEQNSEFMLVKTTLANSDNTLQLLATALPPAYRVGLDGMMEGIVNEVWSNFASQYRLYDSFYDSFDPADMRRNRILTRYINTSSDTVDLLVDFNDNTRALKFPPDPAATGNNHGNDFPSIRYADILLSVAESLNELNGPNQSSIDLINEVRDRTGLNDLILGDFGTKEMLRDQLLMERGWEFWYEGHRRRDMIRMGKFLSSAVSRGKTVQDYHIWFPLPQSAIDSNPLLEQNTGF